MALILEKTRISLDLLCRTQWVYYYNMAHCDLKKTIKEIIANRWFPPVKKKLRFYLDKLRYVYISFNYFRSPKILLYAYIFIFLLPYSVLYAYTSILFLLSFDAND